MDVQIRVKFTSESSTNSSPIRPAIVHSIYGCISCSFPSHKMPPNCNPNTDTSEDQEEANGQEEDDGDQRNAIGRGIVLAFRIPTHLGLGLKCLIKL